MTSGDADTAEPELRRPDGEPVRVLVDDEATLTDLVSMALRYEGWQVRSAANGMTAVRVAKGLAARGVSARVETLVAMAFAASWTPLV